nr:hypothetical protein [Tanacetum cinerariifolium]
GYCSGSHALCQRGQPRIAGSKLGTSDAAGLAQPAPDADVQRCGGGQDVAARSPAARCKLAPEHGPYPAHIQKKTPGF